MKRKGNILRINTINVNVSCYNYHIFFVFWPRTCSYIPEQHFGLPYPITQYDNAIIL